MAKKAKSNATLVCDNCGKRGAKVRHITRSYGKGKDLLVIENVPIVSCPSCGESYITAATLRELERIKVNRRRIATNRSIPVAVFEKAAG